jgi:ATP-dependent DNA ligase
MATKKSKTAKLVDEAMSEVHRNVPRTVKATGKTGVAKEKMLQAVALSKAREAGADIPKPKRKKASKSSY